MTFLKGKGVKVRDRRKLRASERVRESEIRKQQQDDMLKENESTDQGKENGKTKG